MIRRPCSVGSRSAQGVTACSSAARAVCPSRTPPNGQPSARPPPSKVYWVAPLIRQPPGTMRCSQTRYPRRVRAACSIRSHPSLARYIRRGLYRHLNSACAVRHRFSLSEKSGKDPLMTNGLVTIAPLRRCLSDQKPLPKEE